MADMDATIVPRSDQLNGEDLLGGKTLTIKVTKVTVSPTAEQKCTVNYDGDNGKPFKPCKTMCKVMVHVWGRDSALYAGRSMTLYRDPSVRFGADETGGIRISHMSGIDKAMTMTFQKSRGKYGQITVKPLVVQESAPPSSWRSELWAKVQAAGITVDQFAAQFGSLKTLAESKREEAEKWIAAQKSGPADDICPDCNGPLIVGHCYNESCPNGEPPPEA